MLGDPVAGKAEPVGKAKVYLLTKGLPEAAPKKGADCWNRPVWRRESCRR